MGVTANSICHALAHVQGPGRARQDVIRVHWETLSGPPGSCLPGPVMVALGSVPSAAGFAILGILYMWGPSPAHCKHGEVGEILVAAKLATK